MKIKRGLFVTEIEINPGELTDFLRLERVDLFRALMKWLDKYLDFSVKVNKDK